MMGRKIQRVEIFIAYSDNIINTVPELKNTVEDIFFDGQHGDQR